MSTRLFIPVPVLFLLLTACGGPAPTNGVFAGIPYDSAVAYSYDGEGGREIVDEGVLSGPVSKKALLSRKQANAITDLLFDESTYGGPLAACFDPHLGLVFYDEGKPASYVSICLACNYLVSSVPIREEAGFSEKGAKAIAEFEKGLGFSPRQK